MNPELDSPPFEVPKVDLFLEMEKLAVGITRAQYQRLIELADSMGAMNRGIPYRKFRPFETRKYFSFKLSFDADREILMIFPKFHYSLQGLCKSVVAICIPIDSRNRN